jgi:DNA polymerase-3 subunit alpha
MAADFVHLHVHSNYSLLDGALRVKPEMDKPLEQRGDLTHRVARLGMPAVALTDHANMYGAIAFYKACKESGIKPILGCEVNVARQTGAQGKAAGSAPIDHLVLLAATEQGYKSIVKIVSLGHIEPASDVGPSVSFDTFAQNTAGVIVLTGCLGGMVPQSILHNGPEAGVACLERLREVVSPEHLFVELQDHGLPEQAVVNRLLVEAAAKLNLPLVATNDVHYAERADADANVLLGCLGSGSSWEDARQCHHGSSEMFLKSPAEMAQVFPHHPEALKNTAKI